MRRLAVGGLLLTAGCAGAVAFGTGQATGAAPREDPPEVAIGQIRQAWDRLEVDYGLAGGNAAELEVTTPDGQTLVTDLRSGVSGTLTWNRQIDGSHAPAGAYKLTVVARGPGGENQTSKKLTLGLLYTRPPTFTSAGLRVRYDLVENARVVMVIRFPSGKSEEVERRAAFRGHNTITWDLRAHGKRVPAGRYVLQLVATTRSGQTARAVIAGGGHG
jgi:hypothetical protein